jgi:hypothetical protein
MARMSSLQPPLQIVIPDSELVFLAPAAGYFSTGLRASVQCWNGEAQDAAIVNLEVPAERAQFARKVSVKTGLDSAILEKALIDLVVAIQATLRQLPPGETPGHAEADIPYHATDNGLLWLRRTEKGPIPTSLTNFTATLVADVVVDDGSTERRRVYELAAHQAGRTCQFRVPAAHFNAMSWVAEHLGASALIMPGFALKDPARAAIQLLSGQIPTRHVFTHIGWRKIGADWVYFHAGGALGATGGRPEIEVRLEHALARYALRIPDSPEAARQAVRASLRLLTLGPDHVTVPVYAALWHAALGHVDHSLHLVGQTGAGKTALVALAQQHFGAELDAEHLPGSWTSTGNALEGLAFLAKDALVVIDDFCPTGSPADIQRYYRDADRVFRA